MTSRAWELLVSLLSRPDYKDSPIVQRAAQRILRTEGETLIGTLAEQSLSRAREILIQVENLLDEWDLKSLHKAVDSVEERMEGEKLALAPDDELKARAALHVLMPPNAPGMALRTRILVWALQERHPEMAASMLLHLGEDEYDFWDDTEALRRKLVVRLRDGSPELALSLMSHPEQAFEWLYRLLDNPPRDETLFARLVGYLRGNGYWHGASWEGMMELTRQTLARRASLSGVLLITMSDWLRLNADPLRPARTAEYFDICQQVPLELRRNIGEHLRTEIGNTIPRPERRQFLRRLTHWLRPVLQGPDDSLQRDLQADRAAALLMHLPLRRLAKGHLWQTDLASRQRRRFMRRRNQLWQQYIQRRKVALEVVATLDRIAAKKTNE